MPPRTAKRQVNIDALPASVYVEIARDPEGFTRRCEEYEERRLAAEEAEAALEKQQAETAKAVAHLDERQAEMDRVKVLAAEIGAFKKVFEEFYSDYEKGK